MFQIYHPNPSNKPCILPRASSIYYLSIPTSSPPRTWPTPTSVQYEVQTYSPSKKVSRNVKQPRKSPPVDKKSSSVSPTGRHKARSTFWNTSRNTTQLYRYRIHRDLTRFYPPGVTCRTGTVRPVGASNILLRNTQINPAFSQVN